MAEGRAAGTEGLQAGTQERWVGLAINGCSFTLIREIKCIFYSVQTVVGYFVAGYPS